MASKIKCSNPPLPLDVAADILLLLPVKTLSRLKLVCRSWLSLISSPSFRSSHHRGSEQNPLLFVASFESDVGGQRRRRHFHVVDKKRGGGKALLDRGTAGRRPRWAGPFHRLAFSCLDLVCIYDRAGDVYIRNPATGEQITLPRRSSEFRGYVHDGHAVAFAYLPSAGEYKVLRVFFYFNFLQLIRAMSEVFTLGSGRWREKEGAPFAVCNNNAVVADEAVHFLPDTFKARRAVGDPRDGNESIARFDLKREEWSLLPLPGIGHFSRGSRDEAWDFRLTRLGGSLCMECSGRTGVDLWLPEDRGGGCAWVKAYSIDRRCYPHQFRVVDVEEDGSALVERSDRKLQVYNPAEQRVEATIFSGEGNFGVSYYVESFMALDDESFESLKKQAI